MQESTSSEFTPWSVSSKSTDIVRWNGAVWHGGSD
jgi:hypothetical protein